MNIFAAADVGPAVLDDQPRQPQTGAGVRAALAWDTKASWLVKRFLDSSTSQPEAFTCQQTHRRCHGTTSLDIT